MKIIAVMSEKGGIGKTTTAASLGYILAKERSKSVLMIDADQQGNLSTLFNADDPERSGLSILLEATGDERERLNVADVMSTTPYNATIITANGYLQNTNIEIATDQENDQTHRLYYALSKYTLFNECDYIIADCGLVIDMAVLNVLAVADIIIAPVKLGGFEVAALERMRERVEQLHALNKRLELWALATMCGGSKANKEAAEWVQNQSGTQAFNTIIHRSVIAEKYTAARMPLPCYSPRCKVSQDYRALADEIERMDWSHEWVL